MTNGLQYSVGVIVSVTKTTISNGLRYLERLMEYGLDSEFFKHMEDLNCELETMPTEEQMQMRLRSKTQIKNEVLDECYQWGRHLRTRFRLAFGITSDEYELFPNQEFTAARKSETKMMEVMKQLLEIAHEYHDDLAEFNQTETYLCQGEKLLEELRARDANQEEYKEDKHAAAIKRQHVGDELVGLVNKVNMVGRTVADDLNDPVMYSYFRSPWPRYGSNGEDSSADAEEKIL